LNKMNKSTVARLKKLTKELKLQKARESVLGYVQYMDSDFFDLTKRPYLTEIIDALQNMEDGVWERIALSLPPRAGKSYIVSMFVSRSFGTHPDLAIMRNTCTSDLYNKFSRDIRNIVQSKKFQEVFPMVRLDPNQQGLANWRVVKYKPNGKLDDDVSQGYYFGNGVGGSIIGFGANAYAITDDIFSDFIKASSDSARENVITWFDGSHVSRFGNPNVKRIDIGTRWHKEDLIGTLSRRVRDVNGTPYYDKEIIIPALDKNGKSYCEYSRTTEQYIEMRDSIDPVIWAAEYMQKPIDALSKIFPDENLNKFLLHRMPKDGRNVAYIDVADKGIDYLSMPIAKMIMPSDKDGSLFNHVRLYIHDVVFTQDPIEDTIPIIVEKIFEHKIKNIVVEENNDGARFVSELRRAIDAVNMIAKHQGKRTHFCQVDTVKNMGNKLGRIIMAAGEVKRTCWFRDESDKGYDRYGQYATFYKNMQAITRIGKVKHDDAPDSVVGLVDMLASMNMITKVYDLPKNSSLSHHKFG